MRWPEVRRVFELAGANAVPIVSLVSVLVGLIIAFESAQPLAQFGAQIYVANMIGLVMVRELGPLLAAILLAGRSGSAFAAEIGTMKVNEELNALETFDLSPIRFLVVQRITAGILLTLSLIGTPWCSPGDAVCISGRPDRRSRKDDIPTMVFARHSVEIGNCCCVDGGLESRPNPDSHGSDLGLCAFGC